MSAWLAAGWARSSCQSVSVVPMIQWLPQGTMNSRLFSVRVMSPVLALIRLRGTTRWTPLDARTWNSPRPPISRWISSLHTPAALITWRARISNSRSRTVTPEMWSASRRKPVTRVLMATLAP